MTPDREIRVVVAELSLEARLFLVHLLESDPRIRVIGAVADGQAVIDLLQQVRPDVLLMDVSAPGPDGFEAVRRIMETKPLPVVLCSASVDGADLGMRVRAMESGAVAFVEKPSDRDHADRNAVATHLLDTVRLMSEVKVVRRSARPRAGQPVPASGWTQAPSPIAIVGIGTSTGGPPALQVILAGLPKPFPVPILIVQHIAPGFLGGLADWLGRSTGFEVHIASHGVRPLPGQVYLAPDGVHMGIDAGRRIVLSHDAPESGLRPAVSFLFRTLADHCGPAAVGVLLTGMGKDGAAELKQMRDAGAVTIAQDRGSSVVHGMPGEAIALGGVTHVVEACRIAEALITVVVDTNNTSRK